MGKYDPLRDRRPPTRSETSSNVHSISSDAALSLPGESSPDDQPETAQDMDEPT
jgi:hypothetical protein